MDNEAKYRQIYRALKKPDRQLLKQLNSQNAIEWYINTNENSAGKSKAIEDILITRYKPLISTLIDGGYIDWYLNYHNKNLNYATKRIALTNNIELHRGYLDDDMLNCLIESQNNLSSKINLVRSFIGLQSSFLDSFLIRNGFFDVYLFEGGLDELEQLRSLMAISSAKILRYLLDRKILNLKIFQSLEYDAKLLYGQKMLSKKSKTLTDFLIDCDFFNMIRLNDFNESKKIIYAIFSSSHKALIKNFVYDGRILIWYNSITVSADKKQFVEKMLGSMSIDCFVYLRDQRILDDYFKLSDNKLGAISILLRMRLDVAHHFLIDTGLLEYLSGYHYKTQEKMALIEQIFRSQSRKIINYFLNNGFIAWYFSSIDQERFNDYSFSCILSSGHSVLLDMMVHTAFLSNFIYSKSEGKRQIIIEKMLSYPDEKIIEYIINYDFLMWFINRIKNGEKKKKILEKLIKARGEKIKNYVIQNHIVEEYLSLNSSRELLAEAVSTVIANYGNDYTKQIDDNSFEIYIDYLIIQESSSDIYRLCKSRRSSMIRRFLSYVVQHRYFDSLSDDVVSQIAKPILAEGTKELQSMLSTSGLLSRYIKIIMSSDDRVSFIMDLISIQSDIVIDASLADEVVDMLHVEIDKNQKNKLVGMIIKGSSDYLISSLIKKGLLQGYFDCTDSEISDRIAFVLLHGNDELCNFLCERGLIFGYLQQSGSIGEKTARIKKLLSSRKQIFFNFLLESGDLKVTMDEIVCLVNKVELSQAVLQTRLTDAYFFLEEGQYLLLVLSHTKTNEEKLKFINLLLMQRHNAAHNFLRQHRLLDWYICHTTSETRNARFSLIQLTNNERELLAKSG